MQVVSIESILRCRDIIASFKTKSDEPSCNFTFEVQAIQQAIQNAAAFVQNLNAKTLDLRAAYKFLEQYRQDTLAAKKTPQTIALYKDLVYEVVDSIQKTFSRVIHEVTKSNQATTLCQDNVLCEALWFLLQAAFCGFENFKNSYSLDFQSIASGAITSGEVIINILTCLDNAGWLVTVNNIDENSASLLHCVTPKAAVKAAVQAYLISILDHAGGQVLKSIPEIKQFLSSAFKPSCSVPSASHHYLSRSLSGYPSHSCAAGSFPRSISFHSPSYTAHTTSNTATGTKGFFSKLFSSKPHTVDKHHAVTSAACCPHHHPLQPRR